MHSQITAGKIGLRPPALVTIGLSPRASEIAQPGPTPKKTRFISPRGAAASMPVSPLAGEKWVAADFAGRDVKIIMPEPRFHPSERINPSVLQPSIITLQEEDSLRFAFCHNQGCPQALYYDIKTYIKAHCPKSHKIKIAYDPARDLWKVEAQIFLNSNLVHSLHYSFKLCAYYPHSQSDQCELVLIKADSHYPDLPYYLESGRNLVDPGKMNFPSPRPTHTHVATPYARTTDAAPTTELTDADIEEYRLYAFGGGAASMPAEPAKLDMELPRAWFVAGASNPISTPFRAAAQKKNSWPNFSLHPFA